MRVNGALVLAGVLWLISSSAARAQTVPAADLSTITALDCSFPVSTAVAWKAGTPEPKIRTGATLNLKITAIDTQDGTGRIQASGGTEEANVQVFGWNMHLLETNRSGRLRVTTVFGQVTTDGRLKAVHTRTDYLPVDLPNFVSEPDVTQYYGDCAVTR